MTLRAAWVAVLLSAMVGPARGQASPVVESPAPGSESGSRVWLGVFLGDAVDGGVQILDVVPNGPAYRAGLEAGDVVIRVDAAEVADRDALRRAVTRLVPGQAAVFTILRDGRPVTASIAPAAAPPTPWSWRLPPPAEPAPALAAETQAAGAAGGTASEAAAWAGVTLEEIPAELRTHLGGTTEAGLLVTRVEAERPAAGVLKPGDLLLRVQGVPVATTAAFEGAFRAQHGGAIAVEGLRGGQRFTRAFATPPRTPEELARDRRIRALEGAIHELEGTLANLKRELDGLKARHR